MPKVVVVRPHHTGDDTVHSADCRDLAKDAQFSDLYLEYDSLEKCKASYDDDDELIEMGWTWDTVTVKACAKKGN